MPSRTYKFRGSRTHGRGTKAGRGKGIRGGSGAAGTHKHKYIAVVKYAPGYFGRRGFKRHVKAEPKSTINLSDIDRKFDWLVEKGCVKQGEDFVEIDLTVIGIDKLLGGGTLSRKARIRVNSFSKNAEHKIKQLGGEIVTT